MKKDYVITLIIGSVSLLFGSVLFVWTLVNFFSFLEEPTVKEFLLLSFTFVSSVTMTIFGGVAVDFATTNFNEKN